MDQWKNLEQALGELTASGAAEVHEDGKWLASLDGFHSEFRAQGKHTLIHLWSSETSLVRKILSVSACESNHIQIEVQKFGAARPGRLEFIAAAHQRSPVRISREQFRERFERMLAEQFPDARVESLSTAADLKRSFSGLYTRGIMSEGRSSWAVIAAGPSENSLTCEGILSFGLLWLDWTRKKAERRPIEGLRMFLPEGQSRVTLERAGVLSPNAGLEVYEFSKTEFRIQRVEASGRGNVESWLAPRRDAELVLAAASGIIHRVQRLVPEAADSIEISVPLGTHALSFRFRGLEFARWSEGQLYFGLGDPRQRASAGDFSQVAQIIRKIAAKRSPTSSDTKDALYRTAPERWLETIIRAAPERLDASLDPGHLYRQVPALAAGERGIIDLLGVTRQGRLVVIELKASEDLHLPLQAVDYWLRVKRHLVEGDFKRFGYFQGIELRSEPPLVWLVAPGLRFHPANEIQLRYLASEIRVSRIGLNENWRAGVRVLLRQ
ncbi:MAG TPA: hypothetical protein VGR93_07805 [Candidatus Acidoferrales bacterium]|nr:hypothetical protein [Candidatus Acidoferrales bacterium]